MLIKDKEDIYKSSFLKNLSSVAEKYGVEVKFFSVLEFPDVEGLYVALFTDGQCLKSPDLQTIRKFVNEDSREGGLNLKGRLIRLDGFDDFVCHEQIMTYLQNVEVVLRAFRQHNITPPPKLSDESVIYIRNYYENSTNNNVLNYKRTIYSEYLDAILRKSVQQYDFKTDKVKHYDVDVGDGTKLGSQRPEKGKNKVSAEYLTRTCGQVKSLMINGAYKSEIINRLNQTNFLYSISPTMGSENTGIVDGASQTSSVANDTRRFVLSFDGNFTREVRAVFEKVLYPELFKENYKRFEKTFFPLERIQLTDKSVEKFAQLCDKKEIPYVYDRYGDVSFLPAIPIAYPKNYKPQVDKILEDMARDAENTKYSIDGLDCKTDFADNFSEYDFR